MAGQSRPMTEHDSAVDFDWIDEIADRFDAAWKQGPRPRIGHFLEQIAGERRAPLIEELVKIDLEYRSRAGEKPTAEDYLAEFPELLGPDGSMPNGLILYARQVRQKYADAPNAREFQTGSWDPTGGPSRQVRCPNCRNLVPLFDGDVKDLTCPSCGSSFRVQPAGPSAFRSADLPRTLGKFQLLELVGEGSFGSVYKARDAELDRIVAVKVPRSGYFVSAEDKRRFAREARSAARLVHPNIVQVHEIAHEGDMPYIVSDFVAGLTLAQLLADHRPSFRESAELAGQIADALAFAHERKVIHRDVNPRNILLQVADCRLQNERQDKGDNSKSAICNLQSQNSPTSAWPGATKAAWPSPWTARSWGRPPTWPRSKRPATQVRWARRRTSTHWESCSTRCSRVRRPSAVMSAW